MKYQVTFHKVLYILWQVLCLMNSPSRIWFQKLCPGTFAQYCYFQFFLSFCKWNYSVGCIFRFFLLGSFILFWTFSLLFPYFVVKANHILHKHFPFLPLTEVHDAKPLAAQQRATAEFLPKPQCLSWRLKGTLQSFHLGPWELSSLLKGWGLLITITCDGAFAIQISLQSQADCDLQ